MFRKLQNYLFGTLPNDATKFYNGVGAFATPAGGAPWELVGSWTFSVNVTEVDFDVSAYTEIYALALDLISGSIRGVRLSNDGGATYASGGSDYVNITDTGTLGVGSQIGLHNTVSVNARSGIIYLPAIQLTGTRKAWAVPNKATVNAGYFNPASNPLNPITNIRFRDSGAGNITAGSIYVYGR